MSQILKQSELFTENGIEKIEELRSATYVCETCVRVSPDGPWADQPVALFYGSEPHPVSNSRYFGIYINQNDKIFITNGQSAVDEPITGVIADNGDIIYSRYRHDFRRSPDGSVFIDGGRDYYRGSILQEDRYVKLVIEDGELKVSEK